MDILEAEGWGYLEDHFKDAGFIQHDNMCDVFAIHTHKKWGDILLLLKKQWGYLEFFSTATLLKKTKIKDGRINFVFRLK